MSATAGPSGAADASAEDLAPPASAAVGPPGGAPRGPAPPGMGLFLPIWAGYFISSLGSILLSFALGVTIYLDTGSVSRYTLIGLSALIPSMLFTPIVGVLADRFDRRKILIACGISSAFVNGALYHVVHQEPYNLWHIYPLLMIGAGINAWVWPTFSAATTLIVRKKDLGRASGLSQIGSSVSGIIGPTLAAVLLLSIGLRGIVLLNLVSYLVPTAILLLVRFPQPKESAEGAKAKGSFFQEALAGWTFIRDRPALLQLLMVFALVNLFMAWVHILLTPLVLGFASPLALGIVLTIASLGTLVGSIAMAVWGGPRRGRIKTIFSLLGFCALVLLLAAFQPDVTLIASGAFFFVLGFPVMAGCVKVIWQTKVPADLQGRVFAARRMIAGSTMPLALISAGPLADDFFEPLMAEGGALADTVGRVIGVGQGRGIGLLFMLIAVALVALVAAALRSKALRSIEDDLPDSVEGDHDDEGVPFRERDSGLGRRSWVQAAALAVALVVAAAGSMLWLRPPEPLPANAAPELFAAERAATHLTTLARAPHPPGTEEHRRVREYLVEQLEVLGLEAEVQTTVARSRGTALAQVVDVINVMARIPGRRGPDGAIALVAHYDTVPTSPGAADNGAAVASLLETGRALLTGPPLERDVILLFTDAEEPGLHGAQAFVEQHPWARDLGAVLNFDARGHGGPVLMFQTGEDSGAWIPHFLREASLPVGNSLMSHLYEILPNATDFLVFEAAEIPGFNFAFIEGLTHYHTALDRPEDLDPASFQHQGELALGMTRALANLETLPEAAPDRTYFNLLGPVTVHYAWPMAWLSAILAVGAFIALFTVGLRRGRLTPFGLGQGLIAFLGMFIVVPVSITLLWMILNHGLGVPSLMGSTKYAGYYMVAFVLVGMAIFVAVFQFFRTVVSLLDLMLGALVWWVAMVVVTTEAWLPSVTNFLFVWPLLLTVLVLWPLVTSRRAETTPRPTWLLVGGLALAGGLTLALVVPFEAALYVGLQSINGLGGMPLTLAVFLFGILMPQIELVAGRRGHWLPIALGASALGLVVMVTWWSLREDLPRQSTAIYAHDVEHDDHDWFSLDVRPDRWTRLLGFRLGAREPFRRFNPGAGKLLHADAPSVELATPTLEVLEQHRQGAVAEARLRLTATPGVEARMLWLQPADVALDAQLAGTSVSLVSHDGDRGVVLHRLPVPAEEELVVRWRSLEPVELVMVDQVAGLPPIPDLPPRPEMFLARARNALLRSDLTMVRQTLTLGGESDTLPVQTLEGEGTPGEVSTESEGTDSEAAELETTEPSGEGAMPGLGGGDSEVAQPDPGQGAP